MNVTCSNRTWRRGNPAAGSGAAPGSWIPAAPGRSEVVSASRSGTAASICARLMSASVMDPTVIVVGSIISIVASVRSEIWSWSASHPSTPAASA